jgi:hypothetical protein
MNVKSVASRIASGDVQYILGRFKTVRVAYSGVQQLRQFATRVAPDSLPGRPTQFPGQDIGHVVRTIQEEAVFVGLQLPADTVAEIEAFCRTEPLHARNDPDGPTFYHSEVIRGHAPGGRSTPIGAVRDPLRCPAVRRVVDDPVLRAIVRGYLRYQPRDAMPLLYWSFASDFTDAERRALKHHVIDYHYDVGGFNFVYASFYILDTDRHSGAHVMMKRSHNRKPLRMLLGSAVASEADVRQQYGAANEIMIEGPAGTGFIQDTSCYHRATPPTQRDRIMFQIRFS